ncbi:MAG TPA: hypothetical protein VLX59_04390 [Acidimicrobiales bacterium]|nr:hypothetical protein [Acidimicrobiales bacterium]
MQRQSGSRKIISWQTDAAGVKAQIALTIAEGKRLIAKAVACLPEVRYARRHGKILLKGGTTVSAVAEELIGVPLRISGRVSPRGTTASGSPDTSAPHSMLLDKSAWRNIDENVAEAARQLGADDVVIIGANALDGAGRAAMMAGAPGGGNPGASLGAVFAEGAHVIIPVGLEKLIPGSIDSAVRVAGRKSKAKSLGMAVGLLPLIGKVVTELDALTILGKVNPVVIGKGGIAGAEGSVVIVIEGARAEVDRVFDEVRALKGASDSGVKSSWEECSPGPRCKRHPGCVYQNDRAARSSQRARRAKTKRRSPRPAAKVGY